MGAIAIPTDPANYGFPPGLPFELALRQSKPSDILASYGMGQSDWLRLRNDPLFIQALERAVEEVQETGASFKRKAQVQAEELLKTSWKLIHDDSGDVPATVKGDLIKWTMRVAGYDASLDQRAIAQANATQNTALQIVVNLGDK